MVSGVDRFLGGLSHDFDDQGSAWMDADKAGRIKRFVKSAADELRAIKGHAVCPKCEGDGCSFCRKEGFVPKDIYDSIGGDK